ncbi:hypothetical protein K5549_003560 [Capra hircus]|nr:hypothetical protein K5549_003560 [Capra hircus]
MAFRGFSLGLGLLVVKMSSISFYSPFVTSLLSRRFGRLPLLISLKRAAVAGPVIISALFSGLQRRPGPQAPLWGTAGS